MSPIRPNLLLLRYRAQWVRADASSLDQGDEPQASAMSPSGKRWAAIIWCRQHATLRMFRFRNAMFRLVSVASTRHHHRTGAETILSRTYCEPGRPLGILRVAFFILAARLGGRASGLATSRRSQDF